MIREVGAGVGPNFNFMVRWSWGLGTGLLAESKLGPEVLPPKYLMSFY